MNNVSYKLGIHQKDRYGPTPAHIEEINQEGGVLGDIDRYGLETNPGSKYVLPGDVVLREQLQHDEEFDVENYLRRLLQIFKKGGDSELSALENKKTLMYLRKKTY